MGGFFVGQRVRIVGCFPGSGAHRFIGCETRVARFGEGVACPLIGVEIDGGRWGFTADQLEPILPEGAAPSEHATLHDLLDSLEREHIA